MADSLFDTKIRRMLEAGSGVKALLFDDDTKAMLSNLIPHSRFLEKDYFLFDHIGNRGRERIAGITCVAVVRPDNIRLLVEEVADPFYEQYIVMFTNQIDPLMMEILATSDTRCVISEVHEIYIDFFRQDEFLYTLYRSRRNEHTPLYRKKRMIDGLFALVMSLERVPTIKVQSNSPGLLEDAEVLGSRVSQLGFDQGGTIIMLDRTFDLYTPLLYDWRYQSLLYDHAEYENGVVRMGSKSYSMADDPFFNASKFKDMYEVSEDIKGLVRRAEVKKNKLHNLVFDDLEENARISQQVEAHLTQHSHVMRRCARFKEFSEMEMSILQNRGVMQSELEELLSRKDVPVRERSKLLLVYLLKNKRDVGKVGKKYPELTKDVESFEREYISGTQLVQLYGYRFDGDVDMKLGYQPPIGRIVRHWWTNRLRERCFSTVRDSGNPKEFVVVYVRNGLTYSEYRALHEYYRAEMAGKSRIYIVTDTMVSYKNVVD